MKKTIITLLAAALMAATVPAFAMEHKHDAMDEQCARECALLLRDCTREVDSIQQRISKLQVEIKEKGAGTYSVEELRKLDKQLKEAGEALRTLEKPR